MEFNNNLSLYCLTFLLDELLIVDVLWIHNIYDAKTN